MVYFFLGIDPDNYAFKDGPIGSECEQLSVAYKGLCVPKLNDETSKKVRIQNVSKFYIAVTLMAMGLVLLLKLWKSKETIYKKPEQITETVTPLT